MTPLAAGMLAGASVLGVAAGPLIGNLIAGIQIAFTQPIALQLPDRWPLWVRPHDRWHMYPAPDRRSSIGLAPM